MLILLIRFHVIFMLHRHYYYHYYYCLLVQKRAICNLGCDIYKVTFSFDFGCGRTDFGPQRHLQTHLAWELTKSSFPNFRFANSGTAAVVYVDYLRFHSTPLLRSNYNTIVKIIIVSQCVSAELAFLGGDYNYI